MYIRFLNLLKVNCGICFILIIKIYEDLVKPLRALCNLQFERGAKPHHSKEYRLFNGMYNKHLSKKNINKLTKNSKFIAQGKTLNLI
jgi:hypothetical protein